MGERHLRRLFGRELGASPLAVAQTRRVHFAKKLLDETRLPMGQVALAAGFPSVRRFNAAIRRSFQLTPTEIRSRQRALPNGGNSGYLTLHLPFRPPYDWAGLMAFLGPRAIPEVEQVTAHVYRRSVEFDGIAGVIEIRPAHHRHALALKVPVQFSAWLSQVVARVRILCDLGADPDEISRQLKSDPKLRPLVNRRPGLRVPGAWDRFELAVRAVLGQQITVAGATRLAGRLVQIFGEELPGVSDPGPLAGAEIPPRRLFPDPEVLARSNLTELGLPAQRAASLRNLAQAVHTGALPLDPAAPVKTTLARLSQLPGIGHWTAQYIAMRALQEPDAFPTTDLGLRKACPDAAGRPTTPARLAARADRWRPWRAYAAMHLWLRDVPQRGKKGNPC
jgi:AraC family transcriptional regulator of adaptative response / DNA-3-methyladenine glycosylase II